VRNQFAISAKERKIKAMSTIQEIEAAIQSLPPEEREKLIKELPSILPELGGDAEWDRLTSDPSPRPALRELGDDIEAKMKADPGQFPEMFEKDFEQPL
jgi:hypothetical protein